MLGDREAEIFTNECLNKEFVLFCVLIISVFIVLLFSFYYFVFILTIYKTKKSNFMIVREIENTTKVAK